MKEAVELDLLLALPYLVDKKLGKILNNFLSPQNHLRLIIRKLYLAKNQNFGNMTAIHHQRGVFKSLPQTLTMEVYVITAAFRQSPK